MYLGYVTVNLLGALDKLGFKLAEESEKIGITNSAVIRFNKIEFVKDPFTVTLTQEENAILMAVKTPDGNTCKYLFNVGSIGQPRNGDPRASFVIFDSDMLSVTRYVIPYDIAAAQQKILAAGLPERLALRLEKGC